MTTTTNFNWILPNVGGSDNAWGGNLNTNLSSQDTLIYNIARTNISGTAPASPLNVAGVQYINNTIPASLVWSIFDGSQQVTIGTIDTTNHVFLPTDNVANYTGDMKYSAQTANHGGSKGTLWTLCNGQILDTTDYQALFLVIGYTYGGGGASFKVPDLRGATVASVGQSGLTASGLNDPWSQKGQYDPNTMTYTPWAAGNYIGEESHPLIEDELAAHTHTVVASGNPSLVATTGGSSVAGSAVGGTTGSTGVAPPDNAHNTMQPTVFVGSYFIYTGV